MVTARTNWMYTNEFNVSNLTPWWTTHSSTYDDFELCTEAFLPRDAAMLARSCPSVTRVLCDKTKQCTADILIGPRTRKGDHSSYPTSTVVGGRRSLSSEICAQSDPPPSNNADFNRFPLNRKTQRKSSIMTNSKSTTGFPTSYKWSAYVTPKSRKGWLKKRFWGFFSIKFNFSRIKSATKFLCVKTSSGKVVV